MRYGTSVKMGAEVELHRLVDLALRTPDAGVVNFNQLHTLLHAILNHLSVAGDLKVNTQTKTQQQDQQLRQDIQPRSELEVKATTEGHLELHENGSQRNTKSKDTSVEKPHIIRDLSKQEAIESFATVNEDEFNRYDFILERRAHSIT